MNAEIGPSLSNMLNNAPDDVNIAVHVRPKQESDFEEIEAYLATLAGATFEKLPYDGYIALRATSPQIKLLAEHDAVQRLEFDVYATDEPIENQPPGGRAAERLNEFIDQRYSGGIPQGSLPEDPSIEEEPDS